MSFICGGSSNSNRSSKTRTRYHLPKIGPIVISFGYVITTVLGFTLLRKLNLSTGELFVWLVILSGFNFAYLIYTITRIGEFLGNSMSDYLSPELTTPDQYFMRYLRSIDVIEYEEFARWIADKVRFVTPIHKPDPRLIDGLQKEDVAVIYYSQDNSALNVIDYSYETDSEYVAISTDMDSIKEALHRNVNNLSYFEFKIHTKWYMFYIPSLPILFLTWLRNIDNSEKVYIHLSNMKAYTIKTKEKKGSVNASTSYDISTYIKNNWDTGDSCNTLNDLHDFLHNPKSRDRVLDFESETVPYSTDHFYRGIDYKIYNRTIFDHLKPSERYEEAIAKEHEIVKKKIDYQVEQDIKKNGLWNEYPFPSKSVVALYPRVAPYNWKGSLDDWISYAKYYVRNEMNNPYRQQEIESYMCSNHGMVVIPLRNKDGEVLDWGLDWGNIFKNTDHLTPIPVKAPIKPKPVMYTDALSEKKPFQKINEFKISEYRTHESINALYTERELLNLPFDDMHCFEYKGYIIPIFPPDIMARYTSVDYWKEYAKAVIDNRTRIERKSSSDPLIEKIRNGERITTDDISNGACDYVYM